MAERLRKCTPNLIHSDQTGFVLTRYMKDSIRFIKGTGEFVNKKRKKAVVFSLDAEKVIT